MDAGRGARDRSDAAERRLRGHGPRRRQVDGRRPALAHGQQRALRRQGGVAPARRESRRERRLVADHRCAASEHRVRDDGPRSVPNDQRWQALAGHRAGPFPKRFLPEMRGPPLGLRTGRRDRPEPRSDHLRELGARRGFAGALREQRRWDELAADHDDRPALVLGRSSSPPRARSSEPTRRVPACTAAPTAARRGAFPGCRETRSAR